MTYRPSKFEQCVLFVIDSTPKHALGATKLNKVLLEADCASMRETGQSVTGLQSYVRRPHGPVPHGIKNCILKLETLGVLIEASVGTPAGPRRQFTIAEKIDFSDLSAAEKVFLQSAVQKIAPLTAKAASERTHDVLWAETADGDEMPVASMACEPRVPSFEHLEIARRLLASRADEYSKAAGRL